MFPDDLTFLIPKGYYRNLTRVAFFENPRTRGVIRGASTDGTESCWIEAPVGQELKQMPLTLFVDPDDEPEGDPEDPNVLNARAAWLEEAIDNFHTESYETILYTALEYDMAKAMLKATLSADSPLT